MSSSSPDSVTVESVAAEDLVDVLDYDATEADLEDDGATSAHAPTRSRWPRLLAFAGLPLVAIALAALAGYFRWQSGVVEEANAAAVESVHAARDATVQMLSYRPDTVDKQLGGARELLTGDFRDAYTALINDIVIPGSKNKQITATATVPAIGSVSATPGHSVVLLFVNQTTVAGKGTPTSTMSTVRVTLDRIDDRWLVSGFDPI